jgi:hypothetical protein
MCPINVSCKNDQHGIVNALDSGDTDIGSVEVDDTSIWLWE